jgi:Zn finger protein HypA/HybF involved in hydrogenase expression
MHEFAIVEVLVNSLLEQIRYQNAHNIKCVHLRRGSAFSEEALRQAYDILTASTALSDAELIIETVNLIHNCQCGHKQVITSDDLIGHMFICPGCGLIREIDEMHDLEVVDIVTCEDIGCYL